MGGRIQWSLEDLSAALRGRAPGIDGAHIDAALSLLRLPLDRQRWYSECYPVAEAHEAAAALAEWRSLAPVIEPLLISERPTYEYTWHPLPALVIASQFLWHWWELREAAPLIERAIELAETARTPDGLVLLGRAQIASDLTGDRWGEHPYGDPRLYPMGWYFLAEIAEAEGRPADALAWYERFIAVEPGFAPLADFKAPPGRRALGRAAWALRGDRGDPRAAASRGRDALSTRRPAADGRPRGPGRALR